MNSDVANSNNGAVTAPVGRAVRPLPVGSHKPHYRRATRLGERRTAAQFAPFHDPSDIWEIRRDDWLAR